MSRRAAIIVLDGLGIGPAHDTAAYGDTGSDTLGNTLRAVGGLALPTLESLGLGCCAPLAGVRAVEAPTAAWGTCQPAGAGKDSTTGHWEMCGLTLARPFPTYPHGFPDELIAEFAPPDRPRRPGQHGGVRAPPSSTSSGAEHVRTGQWIVYTSADSVFQVAAHEDGGPAGGALRGVRRGAGTAPSAARRVAGDRPAVRRDAWRVEADDQPPGREPSAAGPDAARPAGRRQRAADGAREGG